MEDGDGEGESEGKEGRGEGKKGGRRKEGKGVALKTGLLLPTQQKVAGLWPIRKGCPERHLESQGSTQSTGRSCLCCGLANGHLEAGRKCKLNHNFFEGLIGWAGCLQ